MAAKDAEEQAEKEWDPLILGTAVTTGLIVVDVCVLVAVVDDDIRLLRFECRDLLAAFWADDARIGRSWSHSAGKILCPSAAHRRTGR